MAAWILLVSFVKVRLSESVVQRNPSQKEIQIIPKVLKMGICAVHFTVGSIDLAYLLLS